MRSPKRRGVPAEEISPKNAVWEKRRVVSYGVMLDVPRADGPNQPTTAFEGA
jgi:hypothetical protein